MEKAEQDIKKRLASIENTLKVILCCSLLPKDGPNWDYYESLFSSAEKMLVNDEKGLAEKVQDIILGAKSSNTP